MAWLGLTLECAHCHDHKFDPITQRDRYRFYAFFNNVPEFGEDGRVANAVPMIPAPTVEQQAKMRTIESAIAALDSRVQNREATAKWNEKKAVSRNASLTVPAALSIPCSAANREDKGPSGHACAPEPKLTSAETVRIAKHDPFSFSLWPKPTPADTDVALLSSIDYATNSAAVNYGSGLELRLVAGELEFRLSQRFPNYSLRVRTDVPGMLRFAVMSDPQGAAIVVFTPNPAMPSPQRPAPPAPGTIGWHELYTTDLEAGFDFYNKLLVGAKSAIWTWGQWAFIASSMRATTKPWAMVA